MSLPRSGAAVVVAAVTGAVLAIGQVQGARRVGALLFASCYCQTSNQDWALQVTQLCWYAAVAALMGAFAGGLVTRWRSRVPVALAGAGGALACLWVVVPAARVTTGVTDPVGDARTGVVAGVVLGAVVAMSGWLPAVRRAVCCWAVWVFAVTVASAAPQHPVADFGPEVGPLGAPDLPSTLGSRAVAVLLCAGLAWIAARRGERWPVVAAIAGPVLIVAAYVVGGDLGDAEYRGAGDVTVWVVLTAVGAVAAWLASRPLLHQRRQVEQPLVAADRADEAQSDGTAADDPGRDADGR